MKNFTHGDTKMMMLVLVLSSFFLLTIKMWNDNDDENVYNTPSFLCGVPFFTFMTSKISTNREKQKQYILRNDLALLLLIASLLRNLFFTMCLQCRWRKVAMGTFFSTRESGCISGVFCIFYFSLSFSRTFYLRPHTITILIIAKPKRRNQLFMVRICWGVFCVT